MPSNACIFFSFAINILTQWSISQVSTLLKTDFILSESCSVASDSLSPHGLHSPWNSPGQDPGAVAFPFSRGSSQLRDWTQVSRIAGGLFPGWATRGAHITIVWGNSSRRSQKWKLLLAFHLSYTDFFFLFFPLLKVMQLIAQASRFTMQTRTVLSKRHIREN